MKFLIYRSGNEFPHDLTTPPVKEAFLDHFIETLTYDKGYIPHFLHDEAPFKENEKRTINEREIWVEKGMYKEKRKETGWFVSFDSLDEFVAFNQIYGETNVFVGKENQEMGRIILKNQ